MALPVAALIISFTSNFTKSYEVVYGAEHPKVTTAAEPPATLEGLKPRSTPTRRVWLRCRPDTVRSSGTTPEG
jgi:hypothetical protein